mmetsp:Transcript_39057/g.104810  ORF Transcript_39057/g.104810 Transcript_39057/m.104810 type:complete len:228 (+) Transcript_39057:371-1054(+)
MPIEIRSARCAAWSAQCETPCGAHVNSCEGPATEQYVGCLNAGVQDIHIHAHATPPIQVRINGLDVPWVGPPLHWTVIFVEGLPDLPLFLILFDKLDAPRVLLQQRLECSVRQPPLHHGQLAHARIGLQRRRVELMEKSLQLRVGSILIQHEHPRLFFTGITLTIGNAWVYGHASMLVDLPPRCRHATILREAAHDCLHKLEVPGKGQATCATCPDEAGEKKTARHL